MRPQFRQNSPSPKDEKSSGNRSGRRKLAAALPLFEVASVLVRFDYTASRIVNANHNIM